MIDAVKPAVSDEMVELFGINFWPINAASKIDAQREHIRNALSAALTAPAQPVTGDIADAVLSWMVKHDLLDAGNEYHASDVLAVLDDLAPAQPVGVPEGAEDKFARQIWGYLQGRSAGGMDEMLWFDNHKSAGGPAHIRGIVRSAMLSAAPQPPAEGGWKPTHRHKKRGSTYTVIATGRLQVDGDLDMERVTIYRAEDGTTWVRPDYEFNDGRFEVLPPAPANGGEQNG